MDGELERLRAHLRELLRDRSGRQKEVADAVGRGPRYLHKLAHGEVGLRYERLVEVLDALGVDLGEFTCRALQYYPGAEQLLYPIARAAKPDRELRAMEKALDELLTAAEGSVDELSVRAVRIGALVDDMLASGPREQRRRLRATRRYRTPSFAGAYLDALDELRYRDCHLAAKLAACTAVHLLPRLEAPLADRLALLCRALGVFASSRRMVGHFGVAARALLAGLRVALDRDFSAESPRLYQRATYIVADQGWYSLAEALNKEALVMYAENGDEGGMGKALVDRAFVKFQQGKLDATEPILGRALALLSPDDASTSGYRLTALEILCEIARQRGEYEAAEAHLNHAIAMWDDRTGEPWATLLCVAGRLHLSKGDDLLAERMLVGAFNILERLRSVDVCVLAVDLAEVLMRRGAIREASIVAARADAVVRDSSDSSPLVRSALVELSRQLVDGRATAQNLALLREKLTRVRSRR